MLVLDEAFGFDEQLDADLLYGGFIQVDRFNKSIDPRTLKILVF